MIVYAATRREFTKDVHSNKIEQIILEAFQTRLGRSTADNEVAAWKNSMQYMNNVLVAGDIADDAGVAIEYSIPQTPKRVDFILTGKDEHRIDTAVIVELKQWTDVATTAKDAVVETFVGRAVRETLHPSYQAWSYATLIEDFNESVQEGRIRLVPCAYLHNCRTPETVCATAYKAYLDRAPAFLRDDAERLQRFIRSFVRHGDSGDILYRIERGKIRPSKNLADHLVSLLNGKREFVLIDDQKLVYEQALASSKKAATEAKQVLIIEGGPGTGKSVVAINLLVELIRQRLVAQYVTRNSAPRRVYESKLTGSFTKSRISNLFKGSGAFIDCDADSVHALIVDEAHRLNAKSGMYRKGENQIMEIIRTARLSVFFIDEDQRVTLRDIGEKGEIRKWAEAYNAEVRELELTSQFRCNGADGYLAWADNALQLRETANRTLEGIDFDFRVLDDPNELYRLIVEKNQASNKARLVAGYCWDWKGKKDPSIRDVVIPEHDFAIRWNLGSDGMLWILMPESVNEIGCIHTCQGLEVDYVGVIVGPDLVVRNGKVETDAEKRSFQDASISGYKKMFKKDPDAARALADRIIKNTYRTLMTRGQKGCYLYCVDAETNAYFKRHGSGTEAPSLSEREPYPGMTLRILRSEEVRPYENCVPIFDLEMAAAHEFSEEQALSGHDWVQLPDSFRHRRGHFVTRVVGESMNRRIPNGSWCLFAANPAGSRQGKVVIVQHEDIHDADTGTHCTVKVYSSEKATTDDGWRHKTITLRPDSSVPGYRPIELSIGSDDDLRVVGELVAILQ